MWGDGGYKDQSGNRYSVDSGSIGCILLSDIRADKYDQIERLGNIIEFTRDFDTSGPVRGRDSDGIIRIGHVRIDTDPSDEDEDDY
jgi:hypothetical protein